jgi:Secretory lipase
MIGRDHFDLQVAAWLADDAGDDAPTYLREVLAQVEHTGQRPRWATALSWRPLERTLRRVDVAPGLVFILVVALLLIAVVAAAVLVGSIPRPTRIIALPDASPSQSGPQALPEAARATRLAFRAGDFYDVPDPLEPPGQPGALIYVQRMDDLAAARVYRVLYHSRSVSDRDVAVSGTIWIPASPPPAGGYQIVSFAMDNDGTGDQCALSKADAGGIDGSYGGLMSLITRTGAVVVYTDYEGLGTPEPYPTWVLDSAAHSMLDAARAGRDLLGPTASDRVVLFGHGMGADVATTAGERAAGYAQELDIRGVIAADGGSGDQETSVREFVALGASSGPPTWLLQGIAGYSVAYPELQPEDVLTPVGLEDIRDLDSMCWYDLDDHVAGQSATDVLTTDPLDDPEWAKRIRAMRVDSAPYPTFLVTTGDLVSNPAMKAQAAAFCRGNDAVLLRGYPNAMRDARDHGGDPYRGVWVVAWPDVSQWIADRFAGAAPPGNCAG